MVYHSKAQKGNMNTSIEDEQRRATEINIALYEVVDGVKEVIEQSQEALSNSKAATACVKQLASSFEQRMNLIAKNLPTLVAEQLVDDAAKVVAGAIGQKIRELDDAVKRTNAATANLNHSMDSRSNQLMWLVFGGGLLGAAIPCCLLVFLWLR
jgi:hypothetical protein